MSQPLLSNLTAIAAAHIAGVEALRLDGFWNGIPMPELPLADCKNCKWMGFRGAAEIAAGLHCYMFREAPGERCGKMTTIDKKS